MVYIDIMWVSVLDNILKSTFFPYKLFQTSALLICDFVLSAIKLYLSTVMTHRITITPFCFKC